MNGRRSCRCYRWMMPLHSAALPLPHPVSRPPRRLLLHTGTHPGGLWFACSVPVPRSVPWSRLIVGLILRPALSANARSRPGVRGGNCRVREFSRLRVLRGLSRRSLNEPHEPLLAIDDDFASHPAVFEPVVAGSHESLGFRCRHRPCTSLAVPARPRTGLAPNVDQLWVP
jgi:hypothetical protein